MAAPAPFGAYAPNALQAQILAISRRLPATQLGKTLASPLKNLLMANTSGPIDVETFGAKTRLHPNDNLTDKRALITPQLFDPIERGAIAEHFCEGFNFIDAGANTGLYSLFVAASVGPSAHVIAIEPQPVIKERLAFNIAANNDIQIAHADTALAEGPGVAQLVVRERNLGSSGFARTAPNAGTQVVDVPTMSLFEVMEVHGMQRADALKIDIEGAEDRVLPPFFNQCPPDRLPRLIVMEILSTEWTVDCVQAAIEIGYTEQLRTRRNIVLRRD